MIQMADFPYIN